MARLSDIDLFIVIAFLIACLSIGILKTSRIQCLRDFALGYKNISIIVLVCTIFASSVGAGSTIGVVGKIYDTGLIFVIRQFVDPIYWLIGIYIVASNIERFKGCISLSEIMYKLYGLSGRWITAIASTVMSLGIIAAQALALGVVFNYFFNIEKAYGILIGYGIITFYSALGGIKAVIYTEIFKFIIFFLGIPISYIMIFSKTGGFEIIQNSLPEKYFNLEFSSDNIGMLTGFFLYALLPGFYPAFIQRCLIAKDSFQLKQAFKMIALITIPFSAALCLIAYKVRAYNPSINSDIALLYFINLLPSFMQGLMVSGLVAIIMSLAEAEINATSIILVHDILLSLYPKISNKKQVLAVRLCTVILVISSLSLIELSSNILNLVWLMTNFWGPIITVPMIAGFLGFITNSKSFVTSAIIAMLFTLVGRYIVGEFAIISWSFGMLGSFIGFFSMHYYQIAKGKLPPITSTLNNYPYLQFNLVKLIKKFSNLIVNILKLLKENSGEQRLEIRKFCTFTLSYYFLYSLHITSSPGHVVFAYLISIGYFLCIILLFREFIFTKRMLEKYLIYYWYFLITFCLPFVSSYMLFVSQGDDFWVINGILSTFSLYLFVDARRFLLLYSIGVLCGYILYYHTRQGFEYMQEITAASSIAYIYLFFLFATLFFLRKREKEQEERVETMHMFGGAMAHEVKSPLASLNMCADVVDKLLQQAFHNKKDSGIHYILKLEKNDAYTLLEFSQMLKKISSQGISTVDGLLISLKSNVIAEDKKLISIEECIIQSINDYKLLNPGKDDVEINIIDIFKFYGSLDYIKHLIINLMKNAYKYGGTDVKIEIKTENNKLYFKDNGKGISEEDLPYIFDRFYTKSKSGTGIGLAFCKMIMEDLGGSIECNSKIGKYTEFILTFPKLKKSKKVI